MEQETHTATAIDWMKSYYLDGGVNCLDCPGRGRTDAGFLWCKFVDDGNVDGCLGPIPTELPIGFGFLASQIGKHLPLTILNSRAGFYIGTKESGVPCSRESAEYFSSASDADNALRSGVWTQKQTP